MGNKILYHNTTICGCDGAKFVLTTEATTATVFILRSEDALRRLNSDGMTQTVMKIHKLI